MTKINITSTSNVSATVSDIVLREKALVRLIFRPEIVSHESDPRGSVRGTFIYQKKGKGETWVAALNDGEREALGNVPGDVIWIPRISHGIQSQ